MIYFSLTIGLVLTLTLIEPTYQACNPVYQYECPKSKECIGKAWICDNEHDCSEGEDEEPFMNCQELKCDPNKQFKCKHGQCIPNNWLCDGNRDCPIHHDDEDPYRCGYRYMTGLRRTLRLD